MAWTPLVVALASLQINCSADLITQEPLRCQVDVPSGHAVRFPVSAGGELSASAVFEGRRRELAAVGRTSCGEVLRRRKLVVRVDRCGWLLAARSYRTDRRMPRAVRLEALGAPLSIGL